MTPKEKAIELYNYYNSVETPSEMNGKGQINLVRLSYLASKKCTLRTVDELIESTFSKEWYSNNDIIPADYLLTEYWKEVKQEIEKL